MKRMLFLLLAGLGLQTQAPAQAPPGVIYVTSDGLIHNPDGSRLVMRGFSQNHYWGDTAQNFDAINDVAKSGANTVRAVFGPPLYGIAPADRPAIVRKYILEQKVNVVVEDHGATCMTDDASLDAAVDRWLAPENLNYLLDPALQGKLVLNIANEWSGDRESFAPAYERAIARLRAANIKVPLMIDADGCGQNMEVLFYTFRRLLAADPHHNLIFSIHMYGWYTDGSGRFWDVRTELQKAVVAGMPLVVGEFSYNNGAGSVNYDTRTAMAIYTDLNVGWLAWSWNGNTVESGFNLIAGAGWRLAHGLTPFGLMVISDPKVGLKAPLGGTGPGGPKKRPNR